MCTAAKRKNKHKQKNRFIMIDFILSYVSLSHNKQSPTLNYWLMRNTHMLGFWGTEIWSSCCVFLVSMGCAFHCVSHPLFLLFSTSSLPLIHPTSLLRTEHRAGGAVKLMKSGVVSRPRSPVHS